MFAHFVHVCMTSLPFCARKESLVTKCIPGPGIPSISKIMAS